MDLSTEAFQRISVLSIGVIDTLYRQISCDFYNGSWAPAFRAPLDGPAPSRPFDGPRPSRPFDGPRLRAPLARAQTSGEDGRRKDGI